MKMVTPQSKKACQRSRHASHKTGFTPTSFRRNTARRLAPPNFHQYATLPVAVEVFAAFSCHVRGSSTQVRLSSSHATAWLPSRVNQKRVLPHAPASTNR